MKKISTFHTLFIASISFIALPVLAEVFSPFKDSDGNTKWQYVANFSSSVLILALIILSGFLFFANRRAARSNRELTEIKSHLEEHVKQRTASLESTTIQLANREAYIKSIVDSMPIMLIGLNKNLQITQWNQMAETITGRPFNTIAGMNLWEVYPAITLTQEQVADVLHSKKTTTIKHSQRDQYYFDITLYALSEQEETGIVILVDDITKQMKAENKLVERDKMSAMGELASAMSHDINVPLQSINHALNIIQQQTVKIPDTQKHIISAMLNTAQKSERQASAIVQNLLEFSSNHQGKKQISHIADILDHSITLAGSLYAQPNGLSFNDIAVNKEYADDAPKVPCFTIEMQQVFLRLLRHAFYSLCERTNGTGFVPVINVEVGNFYDSVWVKIQHNGSGLSPDAQQDIFEPFFSNTSTLGGCAVEQRLSYSHFIITDHHKGQIAVTSSEDVGTTFHIQLPLA